MNKIKEAQELADMLLDGAEIRQVGDDKGALPDEPDKLQDSLEDIEDYVTMESDEAKEINKQPFNDDDSMSGMTSRAARNKDIHKGIKRDPIEENNIRQDRIDRRNKGYETHEKRKSSWEEKHGGNVKHFDNGYGKTGGSFVDLKHKEDIMGYKRNDRKAAMRKAMSDFHINQQNKRKNNIKEADQIATAQQKDTLFDKLERVVKDSGELKPSITKEPTTEGMAAKLATYLRGKAGMNTDTDKKKLADKGKEANQKSVKYYNS